MAALQSQRSWELHYGLSPNSTMENILRKKALELGMVVLSCNPSTQETEAEESQVQG
jgi:hypothetical protein